MKHILIAIISIGTLLTSSLAFADGFLYICKKDKTDCRTTDSEVVTWENFQKNKEIEKTYLGSVANWARDPHNPRKNVPAVVLPTRSFTDHSYYGVVTLLKSSTGKKGGSGVDLVLDDYAAADAFCKKLGSLTDDKDDSGRKIAIGGTQPYYVIAVIYKIPNSDKKGSHYCPNAWGWKSGDDEKRK